MVISVIFLCMSQWTYVYFFNVFLGMELVEPRYVYISFSR